MGLPGDESLSLELRTFDYSPARPGRDTWVSQGLVPPWVWLHKHSSLNLAGRTFILCETREVGYRVDLVRMMGEGVAKKEMARRTGLSVQTVRKYLKMIEGK